MRRRFFFNSFARRIGRHDEEEAEGKNRVSFSLFFVFILSAMESRIVRIEHTMERRLERAWTKRHASTATVLVFESTATVEERCAAALLALQTSIGTATFASIAMSAPCTNDRAFPLLRVDPALLPEGATLYLHSRV